MADRAWPMSEEQVAFVIPSCQDLAKRASRSGNFEPWYVTKKLPLHHVLNFVSFVWRRSAEDRLQAGAPKMPQELSACVEAAQEDTVNMSDFALDFYSSDLISVNSDSEEDITEKKDPNLAREELDTPPTPRTLLAWQTTEVNEEITGLEPDDSPWTCRFKRWYLNSGPSPSTAARDQVLSGDRRDEPVLPPLSERLQDVKPARTFKYGTCPRHGTAMSPHIFQSGLRAGRPLLILETITLFVTLFYCWSKKRTFERSRRHEPLIFIHHKNRFFGCRGFATSGGNSMPMGSDNVGIQWQFPLRMCEAGLACCRKRMQACETA